MEEGILKKMMKWRDGSNWKITVFSYFSDLKRFKMNINNILGERASPYWKYVLHVLHVAENNIIDRNLRYGQLRTKNV